MGTILPPNPFGQYYSDSCDVAAGPTNIFTGYVQNTYMKLKTGTNPLDPNTTWVCVAIDDGATLHRGGRIEVSAGTGAPDVIDDDAPSVAACGGNPNNILIQEGEALGGEDYWLDVTPAPDGSTDSLWVCVRFTSMVGYRLKLPGLVPRFRADPEDLNPTYLTDPWPGGTESDDCKAAGGTRYLMAKVGPTPIGLYSWNQSPTRTNLCIRGGGAGGAGGRFVVDTGASTLGLAPVVTASTDVSPCTWPVITRDAPPPTYAVAISPNPFSPDLPVSACVSLNSSGLRVSIGRSETATTEWHQDP